MQTKKPLSFLLILLISFSFLIVFEIPSVKAISGRSSTTNNNVSYGYHHKTFYAATLFWIFYSDGTNLGYMSSSDNSTWATFTAVRACTAGTAFSIWYDKTTNYVHYTYGVNVASAALVYRRGIPYSNGTIVFTAESNIYSVSGRYVARPSICIDQNGFAWVVGALNDGSSTYPWVFKNNKNDGTWSNHFTQQLNTTSNAGWQTQIIPLTDSSGLNRTFVIYSRSATTHYSRQFNESTYGLETATGANLAQGYIWDAVASGTTVHMVYTEVTSNDLEYRKWVPAAGDTKGSWSAVDTPKSAASATSYPNLVLINSTALFLVWTNGTAIYYQIYSNSAWSSPVKWDTGGTVTNNYNAATPYSATQVNGKVSYIWSNSTSSPYFICHKYFTFDLANPQYGTIYTNQTIAGIPVKHATQLSDDVSISKYIFSFKNGTSASWTNDTAVSDSGASVWANVTKKANVEINQTIQFKWYFNDTSNKWNATPTQSYLTEIWWSSSPKVIRDPYQRRTFFAYDRAFIQFNDGNATYQTSASRSDLYRTWRTPQYVARPNALGSVYPEDCASWFNATTNVIHEVYVNNTDLFYRAATVNSNGSWTWLANEQRIAGTTSDRRYLMPNICIDSSGRAMITVCRLLTASNVSMLLFRNENVDGTWSNMTDYPMNLTRTCNGASRAIPLGLPDGKLSIIARFGADGVYGAVSFFHYDGASWSITNQTIPSFTAISHGDYMSATQYNGNIYVSAENHTATFDIVFNWWNLTATSWSTASTIVSNAPDDTSGQLTWYTNNNTLYCFYAHNNTPSTYDTLNYKRWTSGSGWSTATTWITPESQTFIISGRTQAGYPHSYIGTPLMLALGVMKNNVYYLRFYFSTNSLAFNFDVSSQISHIYNSLGFSKEIGFNPTGTIRIWPSLASNKELSYLNTGTIRIFSYLSQEKELGFIPTATILIHSSSSMNKEVYILIVTFLNSEEISPASNLTIGKELGFLNSITILFYPNVTMNLETAFLVFTTIQNGLIKPVSNLAIGKELGFLKTGTIRLHPYNLMNLELTNIFINLIGNILVPNVVTITVDAALTMNDLFQMFGFVLILALAALAIGLLGLGFYVKKRREYD